MTAAAYAKDLLSCIAPNKVEAEKRISDVLSSVEKDVKETRDMVQKIDNDHRRDKVIAKLPFAKGTTFDSSDEGSNREGIEAIITEALDWEKRSGATFEADKTAIIHFAPKVHKTDQGSFNIKGQTVMPRDHVKILGVLMDTRLKYKEHIARAASKGLEAAMSFGDFAV
ncbi:hypothetical protein N7486_005874 [Penicillium sp. IBT 16267x]|nr:hypothetical protein N7486_005874 [Penicillium sp. IBT 16267x]